jgi:hypothetical protein
MVKHHYKTGINKLSLVGMQLPEKYKENFDVLSEDPSNSSLQADVMRKNVCRQTSKLGFRPLHKLIKIPRHSLLIKYQITKLCKISNRKEVDTMISQ